MKALVPAFLVALLGTLCSCLPNPCASAEILVLSTGTFTESTDRPELIDAEAQMTKETVTLEYNDDEGRRYRVTYRIVPR